MKNSFADYDAKDQLHKKRGMDEAARLRSNRMENFGHYAGE